MCCWATAIYLFFRNRLMTSELESVDGKMSHFARRDFQTQICGIAFEKVCSASTRAKFKHLFLSIRLEKKCFEPNLASSTCTVLFVIHCMMIPAPNNSRCDDFAAGVCSVDDYYMLQLVAETLFEEQKRCVSYKYRYRDHGTI